MLEASIDEVADGLASADLFSAVDKRALRRLAQSSQPVNVRAGEVIIRRGDTGDAFYVLRSGLLEVLDDEGARVRVLRAGVAFGELAVLSRKPRTATVRAVRDSELWELPAGAFDALLDTDLGFARAAVRALTALVFESDPRLHSDTRPRVFAVLGLHPAAPVQPLVDAFARRARARIYRVDDAGSPGTWGQIVEASERTDDDVVLVARDPRDDWFHFCAREADRVMAVADSRRDFEPLREAQSVDLVFVGSVSSERIRSAGARVAVRARHLVERTNAHDALDSVIRRVTTQSVGVVLSGGGARGAAHIGVLAALENAGITVDRFGGTSMGALVGALAASGRSPDALRGLLRRELGERKPFTDYAIPRVSLIRANRARSMLERFFRQQTIEELSRSFFCVSADLLSADTVIHREGPLVGAVGASMSLPGIAPPVRDGNRLLVDGGVLNNLPVEVMVAEHEGPVIAVDVMARGAPGRSRNRQLPTIVETLARASTLASRGLADNQRERAALVIVPDLQGIGLLEFKRFDAIVDVGRRAAEAALTDAPCALFGR
jgi:predicted acylesterase/phospholipase RssA/CRP-like cAMP-binding protein